MLLVYDLRYHLQITAGTAQKLEVDWLSFDEYNSLSKCYICKNYIESDEKIVRCSNCPLTFHHDEMNTWFGLTLSQPKCPICKERW